MKKKSFTYNTLLMTGANAVTRLTGFFYRIFLSRCIGAEGLGVFALVMPIYAVCCSIVASGIPVAAMKLNSESNTNGDLSRSRAITLSALKAVLLVSLVLFALVIFSAKPLSLLLGDARTYSSLIILAFAILITGFENVYKSSFYSANNVTAPAITEIAEQLFRISVVVFLLLRYAKGDIAVSSAVLTFGIFAGELLSLIILAVKYRQFSRNVKKINYPSVSSELASIAVPVSAARTAETVFGSASNVLIPAMLTIYGLTRSEATSVLGVISGMVMPLLYLPCIFTNAIAVNIVPFVASNLVKKNYGAIMRKIEKALIAVSVFTLPCAGAMIVYARSIGEILFADERVALILPYMAIGGVLATYRHIFTSVLNACGEAKRASAYSFAGNVLLVLLICLLVPFIGVNGYIFSYVVSNLLLLIPAVITAAKSLHLDSRVFVNSVFPLIPSVIALSLSAFICNFLLGHLSQIYSLLISGVLGGIVYIVFVSFVAVRKKIVLLS